MKKAIAFFFFRWWCPPSFHLFLSQGKKPRPRPPLCLSLTHTHKNISGASHLLEYLAFKATQHRTHFRLVREVSREREIIFSFWFFGGEKRREREREKFYDYEKKNPPTKNEKKKPKKKKTKKVEAIGANVLASASREQMAYAVDVARPLVPEALELLSDAVLNPKFEAWEVEAAAKRLAADAAAMKEGNPQGGLLEARHEVAYTGALARPLLAPAEVLSRLTPEALSAFVAENYAPPRVVLAAAGVGHSELVNLAAPLLESSSSSSSSSSSAPASAPKSKYVGGDCRQFSASGVTHLMLGFEAAGGWRDVSGSVAITVLQFLLGGGGSFSAGGPGKGMHSRLYSRVLARHGWVRTCAAFSSLYNDTGLVGVYAAADSANAAQLVDVVAEELRELASKPVPAAELERAKAAALSSVLMNLESRAVVAEDIGRQVLTYGKRKPVAEFVDAIKALTPASMCAAVKKATATPLSMAALGDIAALPRYSEVAARFK